MKTAPFFSGFPNRFVKLRIWRWPEDISRCLVWHRSFGSEGLPDLVPFTRAMLKANGSWLLYMRIIRLYGSLMEPVSTNDDNPQTLATTLWVFNIAMENGHL
jgi:hypothetical protein